MTDTIKNVLRQGIQQIRQSLSPQFQSMMSQRICNKLLKWPDYREAKHIAIYYPVKGEIDMMSLRQISALHGKYFYFPCIQQEQLIFLPVNAKTEFSPNQFGIPEPNVSREQQIAISSLDIVILPLIAFDKSGTRLGSGKGYYDKTLANNPKPLLIGVAYDFQAQTWIERCSWDIPLDVIITPSRIHCARPRAVYSTSKLLS